MNYLWTEDQGAGFHFWKLANEYLFEGEWIVESKGSNQGLLDAVRELIPAENDTYYLAFDRVYDNMDVVNKLLELQELAGRFPGQIQIMDIICFEYIIFAFDRLIEWTGNSRRDISRMREHILAAVRDHRIEIEHITDEKTRQYLKGFRRYSTERVIKSMTYMLTDKDAWSVRGAQMGECWYKDCCILENPDKKHCGLGGISGAEKLGELLLGAALESFREYCEIGGFHKKGKVLQ